MQQKLQQIRIEAKFGFNVILLKNSKGVTALKQFETHCFKVTLKQISCKNKVRSNECKSGYFYRQTTS